MMRDEPERATSGVAAKVIREADENWTQQDILFWKRLLSGIAALEHQNVWIADRLLFELVDSTLLPLAAQMTGLTIPSSGESIASDSRIAQLLSRWHRDSTSEQLLNAYRNAVDDYQSLCQYLRLSLDLGAAAVAGAALASINTSDTGASGSNGTMPVTMETISLVLPAYNEEDIIGDTIESVLVGASRYCPNFEIIAVNDGSADSTGSIIDAMSTKDASVVPVHHSRNRGYGSALLSGFAAAQGDLLFFMDSDGQFAIDDIADLLRRKDKQPNLVVLGYRERRQDSWLRRFNAWGWKLLVSLTLGLRGIRDIDCAFKLFPTRLLQACQVTSQGAMVNTELLTKMQRMGIPMVQTPVRHFPRQGGRATGANIRVILRAFKELFHLRTRVHGWEIPQEYANTLDKTNLIIRLFES